MNTRCPPKRVPSAARFFTLCRLTVQPPQSYSVGGQRSSGQLTGKPAGARPDYRGRWCADDKYWSRRYKNNEAAKRSRDARRLKENQISVRAAFLEKENAALRQEVADMRKELGRCRNTLHKYEARHGGP
ncbi:UNVERIFIED_CONTAM: hypothetical protein FKN15_057175 [Acipenser sinensis]